MVNLYRVIICCHIVTLSRAFVQGKLAWVGLSAVSLDSFFSWPSLVVSVMSLIAIKDIITYHLTKRHHQILYGSKGQWVIFFSLEISILNFFLEIVKINLILDMHILPTFHYLHYFTYYIPIPIHFHIHYPTHLIIIPYFSIYHIFISYSIYHIILTLGIFLKQMD